MSARHTCIALAIVAVLGVVYLLGFTVNMHAALMPRGVTTNNILGSM